MVNFTAPSQPFLVPWLSRSIALFVGYTVTSVEPNSCLAAMSQAQAVTSYALWRTFFMSRSSEGLEGSVLDELLGDVHSDSFD